MPLRPLLVTADDFGVGLPTSRGILQLAEAGVVSATVMLVNSPYAEDSLRLWWKSGVPLDVGWHPCLTLDSPVLPASRVPGLVDAEGKFPPVGTVVRRAMLGRLPFEQVAAEFRAQLRRFHDLTGFFPRVVNAHHHIHVLPVVGRALREVLGELEFRPFLRRVREGSRELWGHGGARLKRLFLSTLGNRAAKHQADAVLPGATVHLGITNPARLVSEDFFPDWLGRTPRRRRRVVVPSRPTRSFAGRA